MQRFRAPRHSVSVLELLTVLRKDIEDQIVLLVKVAQETLRGDICIRLRLICSFLRITTCLALSIIARMLDGSHPGLVKRQTSGWEPHAGVDIGCFRSHGRLVRRG